MKETTHRVAPHGKKALATLLFCLAASTSAHAEDALLELDALSFFYFEGTQELGRLPIGGEIPMKLERQSPQKWGVTIAPGDLALPPITFPSGKRAEWKLSGPATGELSLEGEKASMTIDAPLEVYVEGSQHAIPFPLRFTTENVESQAEGWVASRKGARLDTDSRVVQLVAAGVSPPTSATAPGMPFYVVLSGRFQQLPAGLAANALP